VVQVTQWAAKLDGLIAKLNEKKRTATGDPLARVETAITECGIVKTAVSELTRDKLQGFFDTGVLQDKLDEQKAAVKKAADLATAALDTGTVVVPPTSLPDHGGRGSRGGERVVGCGQESSRGGSE
jgi:hypothetical protein